MKKIMLFSLLAISPFAFSQEESLVILMLMGLTLSSHQQVTL
jgi:hypothetical protein